jgi:RNA polymerase sigma factor (sigma-70 family)
MERIKVAIAKLDWHLQRVFLGSYVEPKNVKEIAKELDVPQQRVYEWRRLAIEKLRKELDS